MKKNLLILLLILPFISQKVNAQQGVQAGLIVQPSLLTVRGDFLSNSTDNYDPDFNQTLRTSIGLYLDYHFTPYLGVGANISYSPQGQKFLVTNDSGDYLSHFYKFNYIKIPLFLSYNSGGSKARLLGTIGPQLLVLTSAKDRYEGKDHDITDSYAPLNLGFNFGSK